MFIKNLKGVSHVSKRGSFAPTDFSTSFLTICFYISKIIFKKLIFFNNFRWFKCADIKNNFLKIKKIILKYF